MSQYNYKKIFNPKIVQSFGQPKTSSDERSGDQREGWVYVYTEEIILAVNVALATNRPLLIYGASGCGKSSIARNIARCMGWRYYEKVISSRTQARDLLWSFDALRRLSDAQVNQLKDDLNAYIEPGVLWWAFDHQKARYRGSDPETLKELKISPAIEPEDNSEINSDRAVVLLDEIDKADPDVPNNLLVPLGSLEFKIEDTGTIVTTKTPPLVIITTNNERGLPNAFLRRCVVLELKQPNREQLMEVAKAHFGEDEKKLLLYEAIANNVNSHLSTAEYLDTVQACLELNINPDNNDETWQLIHRITLQKPRESLGVV